ncbi:MAG: thiamine diphosphokinase [Pseudomonadota bacterium]
MTDAPDTERFAILLAGPLHVTERVKAQVIGRRVIAADGGIKHAQRLCVKPEIWLGDFDSSSQSDGAAFPTINRTSFPTAKNATDGALAIDTALKMGAQDIVLVGAFGGRTDHAFALMSYASALAARAIKVLMTNGDEEGRPLGPKPQSFDYTPGTLFSVLGFTDLDGLTLEGVRWPLDAIHLPFGDSLSISNEVTTKLTASVTSGAALLLAQLHPKTA